MGLLILVDSKIVVLTNAETIEDIQKEIEKKEGELKKAESKLDDIKKKADEISSAINGLSGKLGVTQSQLNAVQAQIAELTEDINNLNKKMDIRKIELDEKIKIRDATLRNLYISRQQSILQMLLSDTNLVKSAQNTAYYLNYINTSENLIGSINDNIKQYDSDKKEVEEIKAQVEKQRNDLVSLSKKIAAEVANAKTELANASQKQVALQQEKSQIEKKLSELSAKQKALLAEKTETFSTSVGDVPTTGDPNSRADYNPGFSPAFAAFSFGAPHRKGLSQYGAKGRAESGQDYKQILKDYYGDIEIVEPGIPKTIKTDKGEFDIDGKYLKGLAEMPSTWPMEALKAQAIAARTYALSYVGWRMDNKSASGRICTTESCQVWSSSKASSSSAARWHQAVEETKGKIMVGKDTNEIFSAWYAASSGGYNYSYSSLGHKTSGGWDTKCSSKNCWTSDAYESIGGSPWFYKGWYKSRSNKTCGRSNPWLTKEEFADIIGAMVLYQENSDNQKHLSQPDAKSCYGKDIEDTWSKGAVKEKSGITDISDVSVSYSNGGVTAEVKVKTNKGTKTFSGEDFKAIFNLRAPGVIHLTSLLFNVEVK